MIKVPSITYSFKKSNNALSHGLNISGAQPSNSFMSHESHLNSKFGKVPLFGSDMKINKLIKK